MLLVWLLMKVKAWFTGVSKDFSIENMAGRMIDVSACFVFDLFELKMDVKV